MRNVRGRIAAASRNLLYAGACRAGLDRVGRRRNRNALLILTYHGIRPAGLTTGWDWPLLPVDEFERQVAHLRKHYVVKFIDDAWDALVDGETAGPTAVVTFDDGYRSVHDFALPILRDYGIPATVFLATGFIDTDSILWTAELGMAFHGSRTARIDLSGLGMGRVDLGRRRDREAIARAVVARLKRIPPGSREPLVDHVRQALRADGSRRDAFAMMTWREIEELERSGLVTFGAHTVHHEILSRLDDAEVLSEIAGSVDTIRRRLNAVSSFFAYPNGAAGDFDERAVAAVRHAGLRGAVSTMQGFTYAGTDPYALRRFNIGGHMALCEFRILTSGAIPHRGRT
ncbi:MAG TPA: polysaccharide deacetylase family protein [Longimicrobiales bacterium]|nr:polysaccharide deacetylase family protein [Longimicrobiales bacterium]